MDRDPIPLRPISPFGMLCLSSRERASVINILMNYPDGLSFEDLRIEEVKSRTKRFGHLDEIFCRISDEELRSIIFDLEEADLVEKVGEIYKIKKYARKTLERFLPKKDTIN